MSACKAGLAGRATPVQLARSIVAAHTQLAWMPAARRAVASAHHCPLPRHQLRDSMPPGKRHATRRPCTIALSTPTIVRVASKDSPADWYTKAGPPAAPSGVDPEYASMSYDWGMRVGIARAEDLAQIAAENAASRAASEIKAAKTHYHEALAVAEKELADFQETLRVGAEAETRAAGKAASESLADFKIRYMEGVEVEKEREVESLK